MMLRLSLRAMLESLRPRGALAWALTVAGGASVVMMLRAAYYTLRLVGDGGAGRLGAAALMFAPQLLVVAIAAGVLAFFLRRRAKVACGLFVFAGALTALLSLFTTTSEYRRARSYGVSVSFGSIVVPRANTLTRGPDETVTYGTAADGTRLVLDVWRARGVASGKLRPAIVKVHGGGWNSGARGQRAMWNVFLNELGFDVFDIEYRLAPPVRWRDEVGDVKCAVGWVVTNASSYGVDVGRISMMGHSAGGNLALLAAYSSGNPLLPASCNPVDATIRAVINVYGPTDLKKLYSTTGSPDAIQPAMRAFIGGSPDEFSNRYELLSPIRHVKAQTPPTITLQGEADRVVPAEQAQVLDKKLTERGVRHETYFFPWSDHGFDAIWGSFATQAARAKVEAFLRKYG